MSSESLASGKNSSNEAIDEPRGRSDSSADSGSKADISAPTRSLQVETFEDEANESAISLLNSSDENNHKMNLDLASWPLLNDISSKAFTKTGRLSWNPQKSSFTGKTSSLERPTTIRRVSTKSPLEKSSTRRCSSLDSLEVSLTKGVFSLDPFEGPPIKTIQSLDPLKGPSSRRFQSLDPVEGPSSRRFQSLDPVEGPSSRRFRSLDPLEGPSSTRFQSLDPLEGPSSRRFQPLDPLEGPSSTRFQSLDPLEGLSSRRFQSLDPLKEPSSRRLTSLDSLEEALMRTACFSEPAEGLLTSAELEANESFQLTTEQNVFLAWLKSFLSRRTRQFRNSVFYPLFLVALMALPISAGYMGTYYLHLCEGCLTLPFFVYVLGLFGMLIMSLQIITVISKRYFSPPLSGGEYIPLLATLCILCGIVWVIEAIDYYSCEPVFIPPDDAFCLKFFYNYAYYANIGGLLVILLMMLIHIPGCIDSFERDPIQHIRL